MRVCHIVPSLEERHGGPSKSVRALANRLVDADVKTALYSTEARAGSFAPARDDRAAIRVFPRVAPRRLVNSPALRRELLGTEFDCVHHHSLWLLTLRYAAEASRRSDVPLVIAPRGMMSPWAYQHHRWRKYLAGLLVHPGAFRQAAGWHATSPEEAADIQALGFRQPVCVSPNGVDLPDEAELGAARTSWLDLCPSARSRPVALFYSRLHRKKRVLELIDLWLSAPRGDWMLLIAGVAEEYTAAALAATIAARGATDRITVIDSHGHPPPYGIASLFILPSHSENFGLVIAEALAAGVPALVTDTTPWPRLTAQGSGWCVSWSEFAATLATALALPGSELRAMGLRGRKWVAQDYSWEKAAGLLRDFYRQLIHARG